MDPEPKRNRAKSAKRNNPRPRGSHAASVNKSLGLGVFLIFGRVRSDRRKILLQVTNEERGDLIVLILFSRERIKAEKMNGVDQVVKETGEGNLMFLG